MAAVFQKPTDIPWLQARLVPRVKQLEAPLAMWADLPMMGPVSTNNIGKLGKHMENETIMAFCLYFPTCQMRVVRFYQNCSSPSPSSPPPPSPPPLPPLPCSLPTSARSGHCWTSTARVWAHWAPLDLNLGPSELSEHRWTSTWDPPSSVSTAGPQPGTLRAQWAPLDLNLGPSELSEHRWTSTAR